MLGRPPLLPCFLLVKTRILEDVDPLRFGLRECIFTRQITCPDTIERRPQHFLQLGTHRTGIDVSGDLSDAKFKRSLLTSTTSRVRLRAA